MADQQSKALTTDEIAFKLPNASLCLAIPRPARPQSYAAGTTRAKH
jgi:hypothetical protein